MLEMTLVKVKVTIEGHKGQILGQTSNLTYFQHIAFWEIMVTKVESVNCRECLPEHFDTKVLHID